jgi:hypothetical protein
MNTAIHPLPRKQLVLLSIALMAAATAPKWALAQSDQAVERGAPQAPPVTDLAADAIDHARDGLPQQALPPTAEEAPMTTPKAPPTAAGQPPSMMKGDVWSQLDSDHDGRISTSEGRVNADFSTRFAKLDADGDGFVSETEYRAQSSGMDKNRP